MQNHNIKIEDIINIAKKAGEIAMEFYNKDYTIEQKQNKTPVTEVDIAINDYLIKELEKYNYPILSEEVRDDFEKRANTEFVWIIDPLDGTADFIQKTGEFSIMIGLVDNSGKSVLGVVYAPALGELYWAQKNKGAYIMFLRGVFSDEAILIDKNISNQPQNNKNVISTETEYSGEISKLKVQKISVSNNPIQNGKILTSRNHLGEYEQQIAKKYNMKQIPTGSAGLKICWIAGGDAELYINSSDKSGLWDICAADIILTQAGGKITDKNKKQILYNKKEIMLLDGYIASNR